MNLTIDFPALLVSIGWYAIALLILCVLIFVHELGHFLAAKFHNVAVLAFSIGFGPVLFQRKVGETTYAFRIIPLGGFVRMMGDDPRDVGRYAGVSQGSGEKKVLNDLSSDSEESERFSIEPTSKDFIADRSRWFLTQSFWPKFWIVFAGPAFNLIFAVLIAIFSVAIFGASDPVNLPILGEVVPKLSADKAGLKANDYIEKINGRELQNWEDLAKTIRSSKGLPMTFQVRRFNQQDQAKLSEIFQVDKQSENKQGLLALLPQSEQLNIQVEAEPDDAGLASPEERASGDVFRIGISPLLIKAQVGIVDALKIGTFSVWRLSVMTLQSIHGLIVGSISSQHISGPITILNVAGASAKRGLSDALDFMIFLNVSLAVLNLLPIPVLDGGHITFFIIEALKGSPLSLRLRELAQQVGMALLLALMVFAVSNDIFR